MKNVIFSIALILCLVTVAQAHPRDRFIGENAFTGQVDGAAKNAAALVAPWVSLNLQEPETVKWFRMRHHYYRDFNNGDKAFERVYGELRTLVQLCVQNYGNCPRGVTSVEDLKNKYGQALDEFKIYQNSRYWDIIPKNVTAFINAEAQACTNPSADSTHFRGRFAPPQGDPVKEAQCEHFYYVDAGRTYESNYHADNTESTDITGLSFIQVFLRRHALLAKRDFRIRCGHYRIALQARRDFQVRMNLRMQRPDQTVRHLGGYSDGKFVDQCKAHGYNIPASLFPGFE